MRSYAIGDIHGQLDLLDQAMTRIARDRDATGDAEAPVVMVGDFCDRGPNTRGTLDYLIDGLARSEPWICLLGNHDRMMECFLRDPSDMDPGRPDIHWLESRIGGRVTLESYGISTARYEDTPVLERLARDAVPQAHKDFLRALPTSHRRGEVFYCHAGIRPGVPLDQQAEDDLVWIRNEFLESPLDHGALIVHGHTPTRTLEHSGNRINLDTAAAFGGPLSVVVIEGREAHELTDQGRRHLDPIPALVD